MPAGGAVRVHRDPLALPSALRGGEVARNRFDDPSGQFLVRYLATTLRGALLEVLAGFRTSPALERQLAEVAGVESPMSWNRQGSYRRASSPGCRWPVSALARRLRGSST